MIIIESHKHFVIYIYIFTKDFYKLIDGARTHEGASNHKLITCGGLFVLSQQMEPDWQVDVFVMITFGRSQKAAIRVNRQKPGHGGSFG